MKKGKIKYPTITCGKTSIKDKAENPPSGGWAFFPKIPEILPPFKKNKKANKKILADYKY